MIQVMVWLRVGLRLKNTMRKPVILMRDLAVLVNATQKYPIFDTRKCHSTLKFLISENVNLDSRGKEINPQVISFL